MALNKKNRLKKQEDFKEVFKEGKAIGAHFLFIKIRANDLGLNRFGFIVPAKVVKTAVARNKIKRALTEAVRLNIDDMSQGYDVIVGLRKSEEPDKLKTDLIEVLNRARIL